MNSIQKVIKRMGWRTQKQELSPHSVAQEVKKRERWYFGGLASCAAVFVTHPLDTIKVQLQTHQGKNIGVIFVTKNIIKNGGVLALYKGMDASLVRQATYTGARFGIYSSLRNYLSPHQAPNFWMTVGLATVSGVFGGFLGVPTDLINVRMQNDSKLPPDQRRNYKHVFDGLYRVIKEEGFRTLFNGATLVCVRAAIMTVGQLSFYDYTKKSLLNTQYFDDNIRTHFAAAVVAGGISTFLTQPVDVIKTRYMNSKPGEFTGILDVLLKTASDGPTAFFKGFTPSFVRIAPHTIIIFIILEQLRMHFGYIPK